MISRAANLRIHFSSVASELNDYIGSRLALRADCNLLDRIPKIDGFFSLYLREANRICELLYFSSITNSPALLDFLSVAHVTAPDTLFDWEFRSSYLPFVSAGQQPVFAGQDETLAALFSPDFNPRQRVYLPEESKPFIKAAATSAR